MEVLQLAFGSSLFPVSVDGSLTLGSELYIPGLSSLHTMLVHPKRKGLTS